MADKDGLTQGVIPGSPCGVDVLLGHGHLHVGHVQLSPGTLPPHSASHAQHCGSNFQNALR